MKNHKLTGSDVMHHQEYRKLSKGDYIYAYICSLILSFGGLFILFH